MGQPNESIGIKIASNDTFQKKKLKSSYLGRTQKKVKSICVDPKTAGVESWFLVIVNLASYLVSLTSMFLICELTVFINGQVYHLVLKQVSINHVAYYWCILGT